MFTRREFRTLAQNKVGINGLNGRPILENRFSKNRSATSVFLSHAHLDKDLVEQAQAIFKNLGIKVYVDWMDESMPQVCSGITADNIKTKIQANEKFVLLASDSAIASKWCNWEVGIGDTYKLSKDNLLIIPIAESRHTWTGNEYLQLYPQLDIKKDYYGNVTYNVKYPSGRSTSLSSWLKSMVYG